MNRLKVRTGPLGKSIKTFKSEVFRKYLCLGVLKSSSLSWKKAFNSTSWDYIFEKHVVMRHRFRFVWSTVFEILRNVDIH